MIFEVSSVLVVAVSVALAVLVVAVAVLLLRIRRMARLAEPAPVPPEPLAARFPSPHPSAARPEPVPDDANVKAGVLFERFVVSLFAGNPAFRVAHLSRKSSKSFDPDIRIEVLLRGVPFARFLLECKWRARWIEENWRDKCRFELDEEQFQRYCANAKADQATGFLALGLAGQPSEPVELYLVPLRVIFDAVPVSPSSFDPTKKVRCLHREFLAKFAHAGAPALSSN